MGEAAGGGSPPSEGGSSWRGLPTRGGWKQPAPVPVCGPGEWEVQGDCACTLQLRRAVAWWTGCHGCQGKHHSGGGTTALHCCLTDPQGAAAQQALVSRAQQYMIRRTSETLKQYLPAKVQEVRPAGSCCAPTHNIHLGLRILCFGMHSNLTHATTRASRHPGIPSIKGLGSRPSPKPAAPQVIFCRMSALQHSIYKCFLASEAVTGAGERLL